MRIVRVVVPLILSVAALALPVAADAKSTHCSSVTLSGVKFTHFVVKGVKCGYVERALLGPFEEDAQLQPVLGWRNTGSELIPGGYNESWVKGHKSISYRSTT